MALEPWWWDSASTLGAAVIGALIGAVPAFLLAKRSSQELLERDRAARKSANQAAIQRILIKMLAILDALGDLKRHLDEEFAKEGTLRRDNFEPWQLVLPMTGQTASDVPSFAPDELAILFSENENKLMQGLMLLQRRCTSAYVSFEAYCTKRTTVEAMMPIPSSWEDAMATHALTSEQDRGLKQHTIPLNSLILSLRDHLSEDWKFALTLCERLTKFARAQLDRPDLSIEIVQND